MSMFDLIIREAASRFGLDDKAGALVQMLLTYITNKDTGDIAGFMSELSTGGLGDIAKSWLGGGAGALPISSSQIESLLGGQGGLLSSITSKLGIGSSTAASALGFLLPMVIGKLTPGGSIPTSLSSDVMGFITGDASALTKGVTGAAPAPSAGAVSSPASAADGGLMKWLPWLAAGIAALFLLSYCNKGSDAAKQAADGAKNAAEITATVASTATADAAKSTTEVVPAGSGLIAFTHDGAPALKVYFDSGKTAITAGFAETAHALIDHLKTNASSKAVVSGFNDPTNAAANAELYKNRAKGVAAALKAAGITEDRVVLEKPSDTTGSALSNSEARHVEVTIRK